VKKRKSNKHINSQKTVGLFNLRAFLLLLLGFILALYAGWMITASFGYGYSYWYGFYDSEQHIALYAPQNKYRQGFEITTESDHKALFQKIVESVHDDGKGLEDIHYVYKGAEIPFLHNAEIVHLQDVANLINQLHVISITLLFMFLVLYVWHLRSLHQTGNLISAKNQFAIVSILSGVIVVIFLMFGAKEIFYQMHILIFPDDHQWFFYYQDSLMSTLMKAPDLFAGIAIQILLTAFVLFGLGFWLNQSVVKKAQS
tara:strand:- start:458 stop:1228 length:771 start_codon:yes stop_codon:yes gene_type:complete